MKTTYCCILESSDGGILHARQFIDAYKKNGGDIKFVHQEPIYLSRHYDGMPKLKFILAKLLWLYANFLFLWKCLASVIKQKPDVIVLRHNPIHDTLFCQQILGLFFPVLLEVNAVNEIESGTTSINTRIKLDRLAIATANHIFVVSDPIKLFLTQRGYCHADKISVIPNGVDELTFNPDIYTNSSLRNSLGMDANTFVIGFVGNFKKWHGIGNVVEAAKACKGLLANHIFLIVGDGEARASYENEVNQFHLSDTVKFVGRVPHGKIPEYLSIMDVVLSLHCEEPPNRKIDFHGSPLKLFEYMAMNKAIVASPVGQIKSIIQNGINGFLVKGEDSEAVKNTLLELGNNSELRYQLGNNARKTALEHYTWSRNASAVEALCHSISR